MSKEFHFYAIVQRCSVKKVLLEISENSQENTCARVSFSIKLQTGLQKEALAQVFPCEFCEISKNTFFHRALPVAASIHSHHSSRVEYYFFHVMLDELKLLCACHFSGFVNKQKLYS